MELTSSPVLSLKNPVTLPVRIRIARCRNQFTKCNCREASRHPPKRAKVPRQEAPSKRPENLWSAAIRLASRSATFSPPRFAIDKAPYNKTSVAISALHSAQLLSLRPGNWNNSVRRLHASHGPTKLHLLCPAGIRLDTQRKLVRIGNSRRCGRATHRTHLLFAFARGQRQNLPRT
jgi:hypothetical protein